MGNKYISNNEEYILHLMGLEQQKENTPQPFKPDSIVQSIIDKFTDRAKKGKEKYGVTLDRDDLEVLDWIEHAQDEHMDAILYLEKLKQQYDNRCNK